MFDIGFLEICLISVIALLVVGPERLPKLAYEAGKWFGKLQRFVREARTELERELHNQEIQKTLKEQKEELENLKQLGASTREEIQDSIAGTIGADTEQVDSSQADQESSGK